MTRANKVLEGLIDRMGTFYFGASALTVGMNIPDVNASFDMWDALEDLPQDGWKPASKELADFQKSETKKAKEELEELCQAVHTMEQTFANKYLNRVLDKLEEIKKKYQGK